MSIRENIENREKRLLSSHACFSSLSRGRKSPETPCPIRTAFQVDRDRILYSNAFRRLIHKTQVFLSPLGADYRTRLTHTLEVSQIARTIARALSLNEDLTEAIAIGHDLGHTPFGHGGETALKEIYPDGFSHNEQSLRVVDALENNGQGLNLTEEVRNGILRHSKGYGDIIPENPEELACTTEGKIVRVADIFAYLNHDLEDAIRSGVITEDQVPDSCMNVLGRTHSDRATTMMRNLICSTRTFKGKLVLHISDSVNSAMTTLREFLYQNVYRAPKVHNEFIKTKKILSELYTFFLENEQALQTELKKMQLAGLPNNSLSNERRVADLIASMTDRNALDLYRKIFFPSPLF